MQDRYRRLSLWGRSSECGALDQVIASLRTGRSQVLVLRGPAGIGKTALLDYLAASASGCHLVQTAGIESEMELAYAGLHQFCGPMLGSLERLPDPQRDALRVAFGLRTGPPPDRFMVGLAVLGLLAEAAEEHVQVCVVDDAQWLDRASAEILGFVARRLLAERVALVFAVRDELDARLLPRLPELTIGGLSDGAARAFLDALTHGPLDEHVIDRIVAETRGNPLALIEFTRGLGPEQLAGGFGLPDSMPLAAGIEQRFARRYQALPPETRQLLLAAAADPTGDVTLLWSVASHLGIGMEAGGEAEDEGLIEIGSRARFCHPLARSAVYRSASAEERRTIHRALAQVTDALLEPDRRAWHLAQAAAGPDEAAALELERSAKRAHARGGAAAAAAFLERASSLTPEPGLRAQRALAAAAAKRDAGALNAALALLVAVEHGAPDKRRQAEVWRLRGHIALDLQHGGDASRLLLKAARELEPLDSALARETHLEALAAAMWAVGLDGADEVLVEAARAARAAPPAPHPSRPVDVLLDALAVRFTEGFAAAAPTLIRAVAALRGQSADRDAGRWQWAAGNNVTGIIALELFDSEARHLLGVEQVEAARDVGSLAQLQVVLHYLAHTNLPAGELATAAAQIDESRSISEATGNRPVAYTELALAAFRGREAEASALISEISRTAADNGQGRIVSFATYASAVLYNGIGRYEAARDAALLVIDRDVVGYGPLVVAELAEAAARTGDIGLVQRALAWIRQRTSAAPTEWSRGIESRIRALLSRGDEADEFYQESIDLLGATRLRAEEARGHLLYGEWLRRERRRVDARRQLGIAHDRLTAMGLDGFARRALDELQATGATARKRTSPAREQLTAQEEHVARLASQGLSNPEIGVQLFLSARTVEWHMSRVFTKLGIHSRVELRAALAANGETTTSLPGPGRRLVSERECPVARRQDPVGRTRDSRVRPGLCCRRLGVTGAIRPRVTRWRGAAMTTTAGPTVVLVHGAFADAGSWAPVTERLIAAGVPVTAIVNPLRGLASDAAYVASFINQTEGPVLAVGHSYGGAVITNAVPQTSNVVGLVYVAAFAPDEGETLASIVARSKDSVLGSSTLEYKYPTGEGSETASELIIDPAKFREVFTADLPQLQSDVYGLSQRPIAAAAFGEETAKPAWKDLPTWAAVGTADRAAGADVVRSMAQRADATITEIEGSHVIMISQPDAVTAVIQTARAAVS